ncbi:MAG: hypothetical protein FWE30_04200 [Bacteroidales bacterium]|nr:hypothetical protein [Bacteroidales bacterium]MCL2738629.1 hypothetical protein [Bacteroidales bacterium]
MIHQYKASLPGTKAFVRIYQAKASTTLYALHLFLQNDFSFAPDQQVIFRSVNNAGKPVHEYGLFDMGHGSMDQVRLESLHQKGILTIHYVFDIFKGRYLILQFEEMAEEIPRKIYPRTVMEQGGDPDQFREERLPIDVNEEFDSE